MTDILITGATGFVGSHLVKTLASRGERARALVRESSDNSLLGQNGFETVVGGLEDEASLRTAVRGVDTVLHMAAATRALDEATFHEVNAQGTRNLVTAIRAEGGDQRLVYLSSMAAVGPSHGGPVRPEDAPGPLTAYGRSKLAGEAAVLGAGLDAAVVRAPAVYGPGDRDLLPFFRLARYGVLPVVGPGDRKVQMIFGPDLARGMVAAGAAKGVTGIYHVAEPRAYAWSEVLTLMAGIFGRRGVRVPVPKPVLRAAAAVSEGIARWVGNPVIFDREKAKELLAEWLCDTSAAERDLGFEAAVSLAEGLQETVDWYRTYGWL